MIYHRNPPLAYAFTSTSSLSYPDITSIIHQHNNRAPPFNYKDNPVPFYKIKCRKQVKNSSLHRDHILKECPKISNKITSKNSFCLALLMINLSHVTKN